MKKLIFCFAMTGFMMSCGGDADETTTDESGNDNDGTAEVSEEEDEILIDITLTEIDEFPEGCEIQGHVVDAYKWNDRNGTNYFIRTISEIEFTEDDWGQVGNQYLWAFHYRESADGDIDLLRETTDFVKECEFDLNMGHIKESISLTDLDEDEIGEVSFIYRLTCTSDVSSSTQKLIMLEDGAKYPLRGYTEVMGMGGEYEEGEEFGSAPEGFLEHADKLWNQHRTEYDDIKY